MQKIYLLKEELRSLITLLFNLLNIKKNKVISTIKTDDKDKVIETDKLLLAVGIIANTENLGLDKSKVKFEKGHIITDNFMETNEKGIFAIGDVTSPPWLAHKASHEGVICAEKIFGIKDIHTIDTQSIPGCTYCRPQIASIGLTEEQANNLDLDISIGKFPFLGNGKAITLGEEEGFIKTIFNKKSGELLGAHMIGPEVTELINGYSIAKKLETTEIEVFQTIFPHPTLSESMHESVLDAYDRVIHF